MSKRYYIYDKINQQFHFKSEEKDHFIEQNFFPHEDSCFFNSYEDVYNYKDVLTDSLLEENVNFDLVILDYNDNNTILR